MNTKTTATTTTISDAGNSISVVVSVDHPVSMGDARLSIESKPGAIGPMGRCYTNLSKKMALALRDFLVEMFPFDASQPELSPELSEGPSPEPSALGPIPQWVVNNRSQLGVKIGERYFFPSGDGNDMYKRTIQGDLSPYAARPAGALSFVSTTTDGVIYRRVVDENIDDNPPRWELTPLYFLGHVVASPDNNE